MTRRQFKKDVSNVAKQMLSKHGLRWQDIRVNESLPYIAIGENLFFVQGDEAQNMINEFPEDINSRSWLLFFLESAGIL